MKRDDFIVRKIYNEEAFFLEINHSNLKDFIQEEDIYRLIDELNIGIYILDANGHCLYANTHFQEIFGYTLVELQAKTLYALFDPQDVPIVLDGKKKSIDLNNPVKKQIIRGKKKGNERIYLHLLTHTKRDDSKIIIKVIDNTQEVLHEQEFLKTYKELQDFKYALDQSATVSMTDADGVITYVNDKFCEISKFDRSELIGQNHRIVKSGVHPPEQYELFWKVISSGQIARGDICNIAKDGTYWWGGAVTVPFLDENGRPYQYLSIRSDITEQKQMEEEIRKKNEKIQLSERRFRSLVQNSYDVIGILDEKGIIKYLSPSYSRLMAKKETEIMGKSATEFLCQAQIDGSKKFFKDVLNNPGRPLKTEVRFLGKDGNYVYCEAVLTNLLHDESVEGIVVNLKDITEHKLVLEAFFK